MTKIREQTVIIPQKLEMQQLWFISKEGRICFPFIPTVVRCRADILKSILEIVKDKKTAEQVVDLFDKEFPNVMSEFRIKFEYSDPLHALLEAKAKEEK